MTTITIYRITRTRAYRMDEIGTGYSLRPWGSNTEYYEGHDDGGREYVLPDGYHVAESIGQIVHVYDPLGGCCELFEHRSGRPELVSSAGIAVLKAAAGEVTR